MRLRPCRRRFGSQRAAEWVRAHARDQLRAAPLDPDGRAVEFAVKIELSEDATDTDLIEAAWPFIATDTFIGSPLMFVVHVCEPQTCGT